MAIHDSLTIFDECHCEKYFHQWETEHQVFEPHILVQWFFDLSKRYVDFRLPFLYGGQQTPCNYPETASHLEHTRKKIFSACLVYAAQNLMLIQYIFTAYASISDVFFPCFLVLFQNLPIPCPNKMSLSSLC